MATITIKRSNEYNNRMRNFKILIDRQSVGTIANGETKDFVVDEGQHAIKAEIDWCSSQELVIDADDSKIIILKVGGFKNGNWMMPVAGGIIALHFILKITLQIEYTVFLVIPAFILLFYYITVGRKKYLTLERV